ncbi:MAG: YbaB/EbfC family nucleoid-associated protein [Deltaproteobacteria bacterium]|jgi:DNA-binding YbaB/EbfC family protein|nr:YbaB/EbfC family nucleoid-associated protein [Deltaproteobacteria bacterium]
MPNDDASDYSDLIQQAESIKVKIQGILQDAPNKVVTASAGGGAVHVSANGLNQIVAIKLDRQVVNPDDIEMLTDLIIAASNQALADAQAMINEEMAQLSKRMTEPVAKLPR